MNNKDSSEENIDDIDNIISKLDGDK